ncbi:MAG: GNAT family N-acetyltransferase [Pseudomonadota bacterium]
MIEVVTEKNLPEVLPLIRAYQEFYNASDISDEKNSAFFSQFGPNAKDGCQFLFRRSDEVVAFSTVYFSYTSTITSKVGILNDLYTAPAFRGKGIGRQLIEYSKSYAINNGAARLQWITSTDNVNAQRLYDAMDTKKSTWHIYTYGLHQKT